MIVWRRWIFPILLLLVLAAIAAAGVKFAFFTTEEAPAEQPFAEITEPVVAVERGALTSELSLTGTVARDDATPLRSELNGVVTEVHVTDGQAVAKDQVLITVKQEYPVQNIDIRAREAGDISELAVVKGIAVSIGMDLAKLTPARYHLVSTVEPVQLYRLVSAPTEAEVTIAGGPAPFPCTGVGVKVGDDGTSSVQCAIPPDQVVFTGLPATLDLVLGAVDDALIIPTTAVKGGSGTGTVWIQTDTDPKEVAVELGVSDGESVEVTSGLTAGDMIYQFVPGVTAPAEQQCYTDGGEEYCEDSGANW